MDHLATLAGNSKISSSVWAPSVVRISIKLRSKKLNGSDTWKFKSEVSPVARTVSWNRPGYSKWLISSRNNFNIRLCEKGHTVRFFNSKSSRYLTMGMQQKCSRVSTEVSCGASSSREMLPQFEFGGKSNAQHVTLYPPADVSTQPSSITPFITKQEIRSSAT